MRAIVTGAAGFIGGSLAAALSSAGWKVSVIVRPSGRAGLPHPERYCILEADLSQDASHLGRQLGEVDVVFHAAAIRDRWGTKLSNYRQVNIGGTRRLLEAVIGRARRFVHISSVGVLGSPGVLGIDESFPLGPYKGKVGYHASKAAAEGAVMERAGEIETVVVRPTITYGPGDRDGMLTRLAAMMAGGRFLRVGDGRNHFHLTYIDDLVRGLLLAGTHASAAGEVFILAGPESIAARDLIAMLERKLGKKPRRFYVPEGPARSAAFALETMYKAGSVMNIAALKSAPIITRDKIDTLCQHRSFSWAKAYRLMGYKPMVEYEQGLDLTLNWMVSAGLLALPARLSSRHSNLAS